MDTKKEKNTEEDLRQRINDLELAINSSYDGLHLLDKDGFTLLINDACEHNEGLIFDAIKGKTIWQLVDEGFLSESVTIKVLEKQDTVTLIQKVKNGKEMLVTGTPILDDDGNIDKVIVNSRDITDLNKLKKKLSEAEMKVQSAQEQLKRTLKKDIPPTIIAKSPGMQKILDTARIIADVDSNVLITGESGTGKSILSRFIHDNSKRANSQFITIDCSSLPESLFESEMFGYEGGAFTGALTTGKIGLMELANGGTLFLDEIGELSLVSQSKLLRAIQEKEIMRVGGNDVIKIDARIIAATNRNLSEMIKNKTFREDLFYRLNVVPLHVSPLRERPEDIQEIIINISKRICDEYGFNRSFDANAMECLLKYPWSGNVRELENFVERIFVTTNKDIISKQDLPSDFVYESSTIDLKRLEKGNLKDLVNEFEAEILKSLINEGKRPSQIADLFQSDATTIRRKLNKYNIEFK